MFHYIRLCLKFWWLLLLMTLITTGSSAYLSYFYLPSIYSSETTIYVMKAQNATQNNNPSGVYQDLLASDLLVKDYQEIVKSSVIIQTVKDDLQAQYPSLRTEPVDQIMEGITVTVKPGTRLITISVSRRGAQEAADIANGIAEVFQAKSLELLGINNLAIIDRASAPSSPDSPKPVQNMALGLLSGLLGGVVLVLLIDYTRKQLKAEKALLQDKELSQAQEKLLDKELMHRKELRQESELKDNNELKMDQDGNKSVQTV